MDNGYGENLNDIDLEKIGRDPFLISYAVRNPKNFSIVTTENSKPSVKKPSNKKLPDVCKALGVRSIHTFGFIQEMNFKTNWDN